MSEKDIIKSISTNLSEKRNSAALNNYEVLYNNIKYVSKLLDIFVNKIVILEKEIEKEIESADNVSDEFKNQHNSKFYFLDIIPRILLNDIEILKKFSEISKVDDMAEIENNNVHLLKKQFIDYNELVTVTRQTLDSLVSDAYQMILLDVKELNFHVLTSLKSFELYATKSIRQSLFNEEITQALAEFDKLNYKQRVKGHESDITKCSKNTFGQKLDFIFDELGLSSEQDFIKDLKNLFKFSSEFTHIGYISTLFSSSEQLDIVFGSVLGPYLLSTENFNELKYEIIETLVIFFAKIYMSAISKMLEQIFCVKSSKRMTATIENYVKELIEHVKTRNNKYAFVIKEGLIKSKQTIELPCMCGRINHWNPPHNLSDLYCKSCESKFKLIELKGDPGYVMSSSGPIKVIGSNVPDLNDMPFEDRKELFEN
ncbi:hypothetical protein SAMN04489737_0919 [Arcanobacterium phocae]|uniref:Uncharacterized protein n=1 Tax=Arcanobacterium phocae TaxID=131112 RepID=A0A1H2LEU9_9ACTO|nr:hypothetical protein [Arcanobacterium phocae]SDU79553.1 hypothetical protein SAMN04489737_0919 [Arcanobacterium phocae]